MCLEDRNAELLGEIRRQEKQIDSLILLTKSGTNANQNPNTPSRKSITRVSNESSSDLTSRNSEVASLYSELEVSEKRASFYLSMLRVAVGSEENFIVCSGVLSQCVELKQEMEAVIASPKSSKNPSQSIQLLQKLKLAKKAA